MKQPLYKNEMQAFDISCSSIGKQTDRNTSYDAACFIAGKTEEQARTQTGAFSNMNKK